MFLEFLQPIWPCFEKKKNHFPRLHYRKYFCYQSKLKEIRVFIESLKLFAQNPWNIIDMVFNSIFVKRKMQYDSLLSKQKPCHRVINLRGRNLRMALKDYFNFTEIVNNHGFRREILFQVVRFTSLKLHI